MPIQIVEMDNTEIAEHVRVLHEALKTREALRVRIEEMRTRVYAADNNDPEVLGNLYADLAQLNTDILKCNYTVHKEVEVLISLI